MSWREEIARLIMGKKVLPPLIREIAPDDPRVLSRLQFDHTLGGVPVGRDMPVGWPANVNSVVGGRPIADVLPFDPRLRE
jgi:hypothetical protein